MSLAVGRTRHVTLGALFIAIGLSGRAVPAAAQFSAWSAPVSLGPGLNTASTDGCPVVAKSGQTLFFASNRPGGYGGMDIYFTQRETDDDPWEAPQNAGPVVNSSANEICPTLTIDSHHLLFVSDRAGGCGGQDLYVAWRRNKRDDTGWEPAHNLGCAVNSASNDFTPSIFEDPGTGDTVLYFSSNRPGGPGGSDIFTSTLDGSGVFGVPAIVWELSTAFDDQRPYVRKDGLELFFDSNRPGSQSADLWTSTRAATSDPWSAPVNLGTTVNSALVEGRPALSFDGQTLYFMSSRAGGSGGLDLYVTTRSKLHESEP